MPPLLPCWGVGASKYGYLVCVIVCFWVEVLSLAMQCESCGRPLASREEHGAQDLDNPYCIHCTDMKGKLLPFEKLYDDMVASAMQTRWMNKEQAEKYALEEMGKWPAWKDRVDKMLKR